MLHRHPSFSSLTTRNFFPIFVFCLQGQTLRLLLSWNVSWQKIALSPSVSTYGLFLHLCWVYTIFCFCLFSSFSPCLFAQFRFFSRFDDLLIIVQSGWLGTVFLRASGRGEKLLFAEFMVCQAWLHQQNNQIIVVQIMLKTPYVQSFP